MPGLGFLPSPPDPRDHPLELYVPRSAQRQVQREAPGTYIPWTPTMPVLDQGESPKCVAYSAALASTIDERRDAHRTRLFDADEGYARCKERDGIPDIDGTYPRVMLDVKRERGMLTLNTHRPHAIAAYARLQSIEEILTATFLYGSVVLGSVWYEEWFDVPANKTLPEGTFDAGGHAYLVVGWSNYKRAFLIQNSWGPAWGYRIGSTYGRAWLPWAHINFEGDWEAWRSIDAQQ